MIVAQDTAVPTILRDTLKSLPSVQALVSWNGEQKIFWQHVDDVVPLPYIVTSHYMPYDAAKDPRYCDNLWMVVGHTANIDHARQMANAINELDAKWPDTSAFEEVCAYAPLRKVQPYFYRHQVQNVPIFRAGSIIRVRLYLGSLLNGN